MMCDDPLVLTIIAIILYIFCSFALDFYELSICDNNNFTYEELLKCKGEYDGD